MLWGNIVPADTYATLASKFLLHLDFLLILINNLDPHGFPSLSAVE